MRFMKKSSDLYIVVVSYNPGEKIVACLKSLQQAKVPKEWQIKILVVDNGSSDDSVKNVRQLQVKELRVIENERNLGFATGCNIGIKEALANVAQAVMLLNQDTTVGKDFLISLLANEADIVAPVIKFRREGKWRYDFGGKVNWWIGRSTHLELNGYPVKELPSYDLDYVSGCAMMIRKQAFEKIGLFNEKYFLYFEDVDFCLRAKRAGFKIAIEPKSIIFHKLSDTKKRSTWQNIQLVKSNLIFINKYINWPARPLAFGYWLLVSIKILAGLP